MQQRETGGDRENKAREGQQAGRGIDAETERQRQRETIKSYEEGDRRVATTSSNVSLSSTLAETPLLKETWGLMVTTARGIRNTEIQRHAATASLGVTERDT